MTSTELEARGRGARAGLRAGTAVACVGLLAGCAAAPVASRAAAAFGVDRPVSVASPDPAGPPVPTPRPKPTPTPTPTPVVPRERLLVESLTPGGKGPYGVAMVVSVRFDHALDRQARRAVQKRLVVSTTKRIGTASWAWTDARTAVFRPRSFWPASTTVRVAVRLQGLTLSKNADGVRLVGRGVKARTFTIGRAQVTSVDGTTQMATVRRAGRVVREVPVSMGKAGWRTRNGIKAFMDRELDHVFTNTAVGDYSETYRLVARYNLRLTWSGEFLHSAPWAAGRLGSWPGSHGCTNASDEDAGWFYHHALEGDPVVYKNTGGSTMELGNGLGGPWNVGWRQWRAWSSGGLSSTYRAA